MKPIYYFAPGVIEAWGRPQKFSRCRRAVWMAVALAAALLAICAGVAQRQAPCSIPARCAAQRKAWTPCWPG